MASYDPVQQPPPANEVVWFLRLPSSTSWFLGKLDLLVQQGFVAGPLDWLIPPYMLLHWKPAGVPPPQCPLPPIGPSLWCDVLHRPPGDGQRVWVRCSAAGKALRAVWDLKCLAFVTPDEPITITVPWYHIDVWKPR